MRQPPLQIRDSDFNCRALAGLAADVEHRAHHHLHALLSIGEPNGIGVATLHIGVETHAVVDDSDEGSRPSVRSVFTTTSPPSGRGLTPWRMAFSTSVCSDSVGT